MCVFFKRNAHPDGLAPNFGLSAQRLEFVLEGVRAFSDEELCACLERGARLASGAESEPSGAATKTYMCWV